MIPIWPDILPMPSISGYAYEPQSSKIRTEMEIGAKVRRRFTKNSTFFDLTWNFTYNQQEIFDSWFCHIIDDGSKWFQIDLATGKEIKKYNARFIGSYKVTAKALSWVVNAKVEIEQLQTIHEDQIYAVTYDLDILKIADLLHEILINYANSVDIIKTADLLHEILTNSMEIK